MSNNPYEVLGLRRDATDAEIKRAYRKKAHATHPDKSGTTEEFQRTNHAYKLLSDRSRREHFDKTGEDNFNPFTDHQITVEKCASLIAQVLDQCKSESDLDTNDVIEIARNAVRDKIREIAGKVTEMEAMIRKRERFQKRLRKKRRGSEDVLSEIIASAIRDIRVGIEKANEAIASEERVLGMLNDYGYLVDLATAPDHVKWRTFSPGSILGSLSGGDLPGAGG